MTQIMEREEIQLGGAHAMDTRDPKSYAIIGAAMEVHRVLGPGLLEAVYEEALSLEFREREIAFEEQAPIEVRYKHHVLAQTYRADFVCYGGVLIELKAIKRLTDIERAQIINYLKVTGMKTGLLLNFGSASLEYERFKN